MSSHRENHQRRGSARGLSERDPTGRFLTSLQVRYVPTAASFLPDLRVRPQQFSSLAMRICIGLVYAVPRTWSGPSFMGDLMLYPSATTRNRAPRMESSSDGQLGG